MSTSSGSRRQRRRPARSSQTRSQGPAGRRTRVRKETIDFARDYIYVRHDLKRIAIWSILLFVGMIGVYLFVL